jgi:hypothetical protein
MQHIDPGKGERLGIKPSQLDHLFKEGFMETKICPYLYLVDDPSSCKDFPYEGNACHRVKKPVPVKLSYQKSHCLTESHTRCAGYITGWETGGFPKFLRADYPNWKRSLYNTKVWLVSLSIIFLFLLVILIPQITNIGEEIGTRNNDGLIPPAETEYPTLTETLEAPTSTETHAPSATPMPTETPTSTHTATQAPTETFTPTSEPTGTPTHSDGPQPFIIVTKTP